MLPGWHCQLGFQEAGAIRHLEVEWRTRYLEVVAHGSMSSDWFTNITQWSSLQLSGRAGHEMGVYAPDSSAVRCSFFLARVRIRPWGCLLPERRLTRQLCKCSAPPRRFIEVLGPGISRHLAVRVLAVSHRGWRIQTTTAKRCPARGAVTISCAYVLMLRRSPEVGASLLLNSLALCQDRRRQRSASFCLAGLEATPRARSAQPSEARRSRRRWRDWHRA